jgi:hypothetical protein
VIGVRKDLLLGRAACGGFLLGLLPAGVLHFALVEAHRSELRRTAARSFNQAPRSFSMATRKKLIPEPSPRMVIWLAAVTAAMLCGILVFDYAIGDPRIAWFGHTPAQVLDFKKSG